MTTAPAPTTVSASVRFRLEVARVMSGSLVGGAIVIVLAVLAAAIVAANQPGRAISDEALFRMLAIGLVGIVAVEAASAMLLDVMVAGSSSLAVGVGAGIAVGACCLAIAERCRWSIAEARSRPDLADRILSRTLLLMVLGTFVASAGVCGLLLGTFLTS